MSRYILREGESHREACRIAALARSPWTEQKIGALKEGWAKGWSASFIGLQIEMSKNAVIGKAHRLGLSPRPNPTIKRSAS